VISIIATIKGRFISCSLRQYHFEAKDSKPAKDVELYRLTIRDEHAYLEKDQFYTISVNTNTARQLQIDKPTFEREHIGKDIVLVGILTPRQDKLVFTLEGFQ